MTVTGIEEITRSKVMIELDGERAFALYKGELHRYGIAQGQEIEEAAFREIIEDMLPLRAKKRAMHLLKNRSYTTHQLKEKLERSLYPSKAVEDAVAYAASFGYLDDWQYAIDYIEYNKERKSRNRIISDLLKKGISREMSEQAWGEVAGEDSKELENNQILRLLQKKDFSAEMADIKEKERMMAFLYRKGFSIQNIRNALLLDITIN